MKFFLLFWVEEKPTTWYTVLCGRWSVPRSRGGDAHDDLREVSPCVGFLTVACGAPGSAEIATN